MKIERLKKWEVHDAVLYITMHGDGTGLHRVYEGYYVNVYYFQGNYIEVWTSVNGNRVSFNEVSEATLYDNYLHLLSMPIW